MSGGVGYRPLPQINESDRELDVVRPKRKEVLNKKGDMSKKDEPKEEECTCPDKCEVHPEKKKENLEKSKEFFGVIPPTRVDGQH